MSLMVLTMIASLSLGIVGMAEARKHHHNNYDDNYYSRDCNSNHHNYNNYNRRNKPHRVHYVNPRSDVRCYDEPRSDVRCYVEPRCDSRRRHHRAQYVKRHRRHHHHHDHDRYLYPALIGAGVGLLVLGLAH